MVAAHGGTQYVGLTQDTIDALNSGGTVTDTMNVQQWAQRAARQGRVFGTSSGRMEAGAISPTTIKMTIANPSTATRTLYVYRLDLFSSAQVGYYSFLINPTMNLPTTVRPISNHFVGHPNVSSAQGMAEVGDEMTGGSDSGIIIPVPSGGFNKLTFDAPYIISPGVTLAIQATFTAQTFVIATADWIEE